MKASAAVAKVFPIAKHFWCYWHSAKNVANNLKGVRDDDTCTQLLHEMFPAFGGAIFAPSLRCGENQVSPFFGLIAHIWDIRGSAARYGT